MSTNSANNYCPFCDPAEAYRYVLETKLVRAVYPKSPACAYHVLVMPKRHVQRFDQLTESETLEVLAALRRLVEAGEAHIPGFLGYNLLSNNGDESINQRVKHCHLHVFLRSPADEGNPLVGGAHEPKPLSKAQLDTVTQLQGWLAETT